MKRGIYRFESGEEAIEIAHREELSKFFSMIGIEGKNPERTMWGTSFTYDELVKFREFIDVVLDEHKPK